MLVHDDFTLEDQGLFWLARFHHTIDMERLLTLKPQLEDRIPFINKALVVDLSAVDFLDSAAVGVLALLFRHINAKKLKMAFTGAQPQAEAVLEIVGLSDHVPLFYDLHDAEQFLTS